MNTKRLAILAVVLAAIALGAFLALRRPPAPNGSVRMPAPHSPVSTQAPPPANCLLPGPPPVAPNGAVSSQADMRLGHDAAQTFVLQLEAYQTCRYAQADHAAPGVSQAQKDTWVGQGNAAIDQAHALADTFGVQLKVFKAKHPEK